MPTSMFNTNREYDQNEWIITLVNSVKGKFTDRLFGHAVIVVEGVQENGNKFIGEYDITASQYEEHINRIQESLGNATGVITKIRCSPKREERANNTGPFTKTFRPYDHTYGHKSWIATPAESLQMIEAIEKESHALEIEINNAEREMRDPNLPKYQQAGAHRSRLFGGNSGESCVTWAEKMLVIAHVGNGRQSSDSIKASPEIHIKCNIL